MATSASDVISPHDNMDPSQGQAREQEYEGPEKLEDDDPVVWAAAVGCVFLVACWCVVLWKCAPVLKGELKIVSVSFKGVRTERRFGRNSDKQRSPKARTNFTPTEDRYRADSVGIDGLDGAHETQRTEAAIPGAVTSADDEDILPLGGQVLNVSPRSP
eukprot:COSAG05_NODE_356_length_10852_cov_10.168418_2_plen_159_part_00